MNKRYDVYRRVGRRFVSGWLEPEVLTILAVLDSAQRSKNVSGAVAEIGVHHGKLFIGLSLLQQDTEHSVAIDVFGDQELNIDKSGKGNLAAFRRNVERWSSLAAVEIHQGDSTKLLADNLRELARGNIRLFSVDGGHTDSIVFSDMNLAEATLAQGGIVIADDIFNQQWPGVSTGTLRYMSQGGQLVPFAIGFNKVYFSLPEHAEFYRDKLRSHFENRFLEFVILSDFATHDVVIINRVPRQPRKLIGRSQMARNAYLRIQELRSARD